MWFEPTAFRHFQKFFQSLFWRGRSSAVESLIVIQVAMGSNPIGHPKVDLQCLVRLMVGPHPYKVQTLVRFQHEVPRF